MSQIIELELNGLTCGHCVKRVKESLEQRDDVEQAEISQTHARVTGHATADALIETIKQAGYQAQVTHHPKPEPLAELDTPSEVLTAASSSPATSTFADSHQLLIEGMSCASCVSRVQNALQNVPGVSQARVNLAERTALVMGEVDSQSLVIAVQKAGYTAEAIEDDIKRRERQQQSAKMATHRFRWQAIVALALGIPVMLWGMWSGNMMVTDTNRTLWLIIGVMTLGVMIVAGGHFYRSAWRSLGNKTATMDSLVALGTGAAWLYSITVNIWPHSFPMEARHLYYEASMMIIGLINLGHMLEQRARQQASRALERLLDLTPPTARRVTENGEVSVPLAEVTEGTILRLTAGDRVPVDGNITQGEAWFDEAMLTGEPTPQHKTPGAALHAGTQVQDGSVLFRATAIGRHTMLSRIIQLVRQAQSSKPEIGQLADKISAIFVPVVIVIALVSAAIWYFIGPAPQMVYSLVIATTVLIIACPCALGLATPMSVIAGVGRAAEYGALVRDADALQRASQVDTVVFDKTGTLTEGKPQVVQISPVKGMDEQAVIRLAAALEQGSSHPLARAFVDKVKNVALPVVETFHTLQGLGLSGKIENQSLLLGNEALLLQHNIDTQPLAAEIEDCSRLGATPVLLAIEGKLAALFAIRDPLRADSIEALERLRKQGYRLVMLTGDNPLTANTIAQEAGITEVIAGVLPDGKAQAIKLLQQQGRRIAMVGDGINDAPALAQAEVGIAMGGGSDVAIETASITLMRPGLLALVDALAISKATLGNMKQNLLGAFIYNALGIPVAAGILYPFTGTLLNPVVASAAMALSSITVVSNANRLLRFKPRV